MITSNMFAEISKAARESKLIGFLLMILITFISIGLPMISLDMRY